MRSFLFVLASFFIIGSAVLTDHLDGNRLPTKVDLEEEAAVADLIIVETPRPGEKISSPLVVRGKARGYWFFEGSFPVRLLDATNVEIVLGLAENPNWMTEQFVPFEVTLQFEKPVQRFGTLVLERSDPSGRYPQALRIPVFFK